ncbi:MAG: hypothetical protein COU11_02690 [Candidatus Harrisonbacteria bacterium CG10_big_fil_rev_8_21_14_0_10_49_15]|uniref:VIT family protein n=1 Tax=Candidatus Harrisonbacteria bacterium CG10_big_fil_rev_8_21_14_0_10_49_15 TaxID=1974587 RepID=A0A2H0UL47_9BACT|nr:MAG: hypothetical protein COU11_02690 [Candidatus Harrisonbacteria bacterium CG10_big_fil_rev_8_21_14_0_10_49_15]
MKKALGAVYFRNFIFGVEDSLVSTVGLLSGVAIADVPRATIFLTGMVLIFVEAFSMGVGSFLSEHSASDFEGAPEKARRSIVWPALVMFVSYFVSGFIPLFPYIVLPVSAALAVSVVVSLLALFGLGAVSGKITKKSVVREGLRMLIIGGGAVLLGVLVGKMIGV